MGRNATNVLLACDTAGALAAASAATYRHSITAVAVQVAEQEVAHACCGAAQAPHVSDQRAHAVAVQGAVKHGARAGERWLVLPPR
jgi:hypothetical protein